MTPSIPHRARAAARLGAAILACALAAGAAHATGIYKWTDENGKVHYGDRPPAKGASEVEIEGGSGPATRVPDAGARKQQQERLIEEFDRKRADASAAKQKQREVSSKRERICQQAKAVLAKLERANTVSKKNAAGQRVYLDDEQRAEVTQKYEQLAEKNC